MTRTLKFALRVEVNSRGVAQPEDLKVGGGVIMVTPPLDEAYWLLRVQVSPQGQAVVLFPKFGVFGIGFQYEEDWNTNLPSDCTAEKILAHIWHNHRDRFPKARALEAIKLLQAEINRLTRKGHVNAD